MAWGRAATSSVAASIASAAPTAIRRSRSTSTGARVSAMMPIGIADATPSQRRGSLIAHHVPLGDERALGRQDGAAEPRVEPREDARDRHEWRDDEAIEHAVEEPAFE